MKAYVKPSVELAASVLPPLLSSSDGNPSKEENIEIEIDNDNEYNETFHAKPHYFWEDDRLDDSL